jgi:hypothetical protein
MTMLAQIKRLFSRYGFQAKKARAPIYAALRALSIEELKVEGRR